MALSAKKPKEKPPTLHVALRQQQQQFINYLLEILSCFNKLQYLTILKLLGWCGVIHSGSLNKHRVSQNAFTLRCKVKQWIFAPLHFTESTTTTTTTTQGRTEHSGTEYPDHERARDHKINK